MRALSTTRAVGALVITLLAGAMAVIFPSASALADGKSAATLLYPGFFGVAATSARNAWAVGEYQSGTVQRTLIVHWDGRAWRRAPSPNPDATGDFLYAVAAISAADAWAVGGQQDGKSLIVHWDGKAWRQVPSPAGGQLAGVAATSRLNAWAVGSGGPRLVRAVIESWNGRSWREVRGPVMTGNLFAVAATSRSNAWAVGFSGLASRTTHALTLHWNGKAWVQVRSPDPAGAGDLVGVAATPAGSAWAVSGAALKTPLNFATVIDHWNGRAWKRAPSPNPVPGGAVLYAVAAASATSAWAVGTNFYYPTDANVIEHWNGKTWALVPSPIVDGLLAGVTATSPTNAWAVGTGDAGATILHWDGHRWSGITLFS